MNQIIRGPRLYAPRTFRSAVYYVGDSSSTDGTNGFSAQNDDHAIRFEVGVATTFDRIGLHITVAGAGGGTIRLGIRYDNGAMYPSTLILDAGTIASDSTGAKEITISQFLPAGRYWLTAAVQGGAPTVRAYSPDPYVGWNSGTVATFAGYKQTGITGALPTTFSTTTLPAFGPRVYLRAI